MVVCVFEEISSFHLSCQILSVELLMLFSYQVVSDSLQPLDCSPPGSSVRGILQTRTLEWVARFLLQGIFPTRD